tara:strand:- start:4707 stop:7991 length:3285 start_codon:yes stop_codon:yes gene_type:complete
MSEPKSPDVVANPGATVLPEVLSSPGSQPAPAAVVGPAVRGPAFVPFDIANKSDFSKVFGDPFENRIPSLHNGPLAANRYFENDGASVVYFRTLGAGDCKARTTAGTNLGHVNNSGFVVGQEQVNTGTNVIGANPYAGSDRGVLGRSYFLTTLMSESAGSTMFSDVGMTANSAHPILRGILFAPSGVVLSLSSNLEPNNVPTSGGAHGSFGAATDGGANIGTVDLKNGSQSFVLLLNGHTSTSVYPSAVTASFDSQATYEDAISSDIADVLPPNVGPNDSMYFKNVFNRNPYKLQEAGHFLYIDYPVQTNFAHITGSGVVDNTVDFQNREPLALLLTSTLDRNTGTSTNIVTDKIGIPNFENFEDRFSSAFSPFVTSQIIEGTRYDLFRLHAFSSGISGTGLKFTVQNIVPPTNGGFSSFEIALRHWAHADVSVEAPLMSFECNLDPNSDSFIGKKIGDMHEFYDFDAASGEDKTVIIGKYPLTNVYVRVEMSRDFENGNIPSNVVPAGFRGIYHLVTSGTSASGGGSILTGSVGSTSTADTTGIGSEVIKSVVQPPVPFRERISLSHPIFPFNPDSPVMYQPISLFTWGIQYEKKWSPSIPTIELSPTIEDNPLSWFTYIPNFHTEYQNPWVGDNAGEPDVGGTILDADRFNNNLFTLERIAIITGSGDILRPAELADPDEWGAAIYMRNGKLPDTLRKSYPVGSSDKIRFVNPLLDLTDPGSRLHLKFTVPFMGGFDGLNIFDKEAANMTDVAIFRDRSNFGESGRFESTTASFRKAISILSEKSEADMQILTLPGIRHRSVVDHAIESCEDKNDVLFVGDIELYDESAQYITASTQEPHVPQIIKKFAGRGIQSSFSAFYYPDVFIDFDPDGATPPIKVPASTAALGAIAKTDHIAGQAAAPMGYTRGAILDGIDSEMGFLISDRDNLIANNINPIGGDPAGISDGVLPIISQKTALNAGSVLDRVNVRRLMIAIRRQIRNLARNILFSPLNVKTTELFKNQMDDFLNGLVANQQIEDFKIVMSPKYRADASTDAKNNILVNRDRFKGFGGLLNRTTDQELEAKTIRGAVFIKPFASDETIKLDVDESGEE